MTLGLATSPGSFARCGKPRGAPAAGQHGVLYYDRLAVDPAAGKKPALTGRDEAAKTDLKAPGPGAADAFRNSV